MPAVTVASTSRAWYEASTTNYWSARIAFDTGTSLYVVTQDTGASLKLRVLKADSRTAPTTFTEQDSANNKAVNADTSPYSAWYDTTRYIHIVCFTAATTLTHYVFDTSTDTWTSLGHGNATTAASVKRPLRIVSTTADDPIIIANSSTDDADLLGVGWDGAAWLFSASFYVAGTSAEASTVADAVIGSTRVYLYTDVVLDDLFAATRSASNVKTQVAIDTSVQALDTGHSAGGVFIPFVESTVNKAVVAYISSTGTLRESVVSLDTNPITTSQIAATVAIEATATNVGARTPISTARFGTTDYALWWDDASAGTIFYATKSAGVWGGRTAWKTGVSRPIQLLPVGTDGLLAVYQSDATTIATDWIVAPASGATFTRTVTQTAAIRTTTSRTITQTAAIKSVDLTRTVGQTAALKTILTRTVPETAAVITTSLRTVPETAALRTTPTRTVTQTAAILTKQARTVTQTANISVVVTSMRTVGQTVAVKVNDLARTVPEAAAVLTTNPRTVPQTGAIRVNGLIRSVSQTVALRTSLSRTVTQSAAITTATARTIPETAAILATSTRAVPQEANLSVTGSFDRTVSQTAAVTTTLARTVAQTAAITTKIPRTVGQTAATSTTNSPTVTQTAALKKTASRSIPQSANISVAGSFARTITQTAAILTARSRTVPQSGALGTTGTRTIAQDAAIAAVATVSLTVPQSVAVSLTVSRTVAQFVAIASGTSRLVPQSAALRVNDVVRTIPQTAVVALGLLGQALGLVTRTQDVMPVSATRTIAEAISATRTQLPMPVIATRIQEN